MSAELALEPIDFDETGAHPVVVVDAPPDRGGIRPCVVCVSGDDLGRSVQLEGERLELGRSPDGLALTASDVSRHHALLRRDGDGFVLEDLDSVNGTFLNGERVTSPVRVRLGDRIQLGRTVLVFSHHDELQGRVEQLQRLEALATLAGGIAHDFNNALGVIMGNLGFVQEALPKDDALAKEALDAIQTATTSATKLAKRLLRLGRQEPMTIGPVALDQLIEQTLRLGRRRAPPRLIVDTDLEPGIRVLGSYEELQHALVNLFNNSCDAMPAGGTLRIRTRAIRLDAAESLEHHLESPGEYVELVFSDTGCGMDAATQARAFEPFFTTKARDKGTGLGLAMIHGTVRRHGGAIELESEPGRGTTFRIYLHRKV